MTLSARCQDTASGTGRDHRRFERPDEWPDEEAPSRQAEDRIGDELAGAVIRDLTATLDPQDLNAASRQFIGRRQNVALIGLAAQRQDGGMLEEEQAVASGLVGSGGGQLLLERPRLAVRNAPEPGRANRVT
jgi:hypothetical protein